MCQYTGSVLSCFEIFLLTLIFKVIQFFYPKRKTWSTSVSNAPDTLRIRQDEWELEQRTNGQEKLTIEGSDAEGNSIFIDIASDGELDFASFRLCFNGSTYVLPSYPLPTYSPKSRREPNIFSIGGLRVELREPFRRWRISFRGLLRYIEPVT
uniref:Uncharacterized protein n=1 Tax=Plectus sambesii TaxID=2011161 RepID=A0A914XJZ5_9BILA